MRRTTQEIAVRCANCKAALGAETTRAWWGKDGQPYCDYHCERAFRRKTLAGDFDDD